MPFQNEQIFRCATPVFKSPLLRLIHGCSARRVPEECRNLSPRPFQEDIYSFEDLFSLHMANASGLTLCNSACEGISFSVILIQLKRVASYLIHEKKGGADDGEDLRKAAMRELREETGVTSAEFLAEAPYWVTYDFPLEIRKKLNRRWRTNYKGQAQKWFLFKFTGKEDEINLLGDGSEEPEFKEWSWKLPEQVLALAVDFKKPVYEQVLRVFGPYLSGVVDAEISSTKNKPSLYVLRK